MSSYSNQRQGHTDDTRQRECNKRQTDGDAILLCITSSPPHTHTLMGRSVNGFEL